MPPFNSMKTISLTAIFDGQQIKLDEPIVLKPNTRLLVTVLPDESPDDEHRDWTTLGLHSLSRAYGPAEPEYTLDMLKENNPKYDSAPAAAAAGFGQPSPVPPMT